MGWKSTVNINREEAINLILARMNITRLYNITNSELEDELEKLGYGDELDLEYFGYKFNIL